MDEKPIALVTGANKGLGKEVARQLGKRGLRVYLGSRNWTRGEETAGKACRAAGAALRDGRRSLRRRARRETAPGDRVHLFSPRAKAGSDGAAARPRLRHIPPPPYDRARPSRAVALGPRARLAGVARCALS